MGKLISPILPHIFSYKQEPFISSSPIISECKKEITKTLHKTEYFIPYIILIGH